MEQNESVTKHHLVRRATIIFLVGMAVLTLFSNMIVNYSLPRVQVKNFESGIIFRQIQADGTVVAQLQHTINFAAARTVDQVKVEVGSPVLVGDVLATLKPIESLELLEMEKALENAELDFAKMKETAAPITVAGAEKAVKLAERAITAAQKSIVKDEEAVVDAKDNLAEAWDALDKAVQDAEDNLDDARDNQDDKENLLDAAQADLAAAEAALAASTLDPATDEYKALQAAVETAKDNVDTAESDLQSAEDAVDAAEKVLSDAKKAKDKGPTSYEDAVTSAEETLADAKEAYPDVVDSLNTARKDLATARKTDAQAAKDRTRELEKAENNLVVQREKLKQYKATQTVNQIVSSYAGRISKLAIAPGTAINPSEALVVIDAADAKYELHATLPVDQAKVLVLGDRADVMMGSKGWAQATLREIRDDKDQPGVVKQLVFDVDGEVTLGQQVTISIYKQSRNYEMIVPNAAVRQDASGSFVLAMRQKNGPLGSRYTLERISVTVLETDSSRSAISAALEYGMPIVTAANKPVEAGSRVLPTK